jgi:hypothetical protein
MATAKGLRDTVFENMNRRKELTFDPEIGLWVLFSVE